MPSVGGKVYARKPVNNEVDRREEDEAVSKVAVLDAGSGR